ncbi:MAG: hypothetical protein KIT72_14460 [Polyangiaceae bacterium]|nr:hypothetical protein [Polyangiaceae bacterium]MCW5791616.1 hypothetical protein [Polyangiaceae bacterium]
MWLLPPMPIDTVVQLASDTSVRPEVCRGRSARAALWPPDGAPSRVEYCRWLARGYSALERDPLGALALADRATARFRGDAASRWLAGQALTALGRYAEADARFREATRMAPLGPSGAAPLQDLARAAAMTGDSARAAEAYGRLLARAGALAAEARRQAAPVEAALAQMNAGELDRALGTLQSRGEGRGVRAPGWEAYLQGALGLAYSRAGREPEAQGALRDVGTSVLSLHLATLREGGAPARGLPVIPEADLHALLGMLSEDRAERAQHWRRYLELVPEGAPTRAHAAERAR